MRKFFNGEFGLGTTYWIGVVAVGILIRIVVRFINKGFMTIQDDAKFAQLEMLHTVFLVAVCIYMLLMVRAMIKAGFDGRRPGGWGWTGIVLTITSTLYALYITMTVLVPSTVTPKFILEMEVSQLNRQLPQDMGDGLTMTRAAIKGDELIYYIQVDEQLDPAVKTALQSPMMDTPEGQDICQEFQGYFKGGISAIVYEFGYKNDTVRRDVNGADCMAWLAEQ